MRYDHLLTLIDEIKPRVVVEVGVAKAERAVAMCERALQYRDDVEYVGYDVFDTKDAAFHAAAYNLKKVASVDVCRDRMAALKHRHKKFCYWFIVGDTRQTLKDNSVVADLAFIDGDHRIEAIRSDYAALKASTVVVLDDYYTRDEQGCPDIDKVGCNRLVEELGERVTLLPTKDKVRHGGNVQMAVVR